MDLRLPFNTLAFRTCTHSEIILRLAYNLNSSHTFTPSESFMHYHKISGSSWICTQSQIISRFSHNLRSLLFCLVLFWATPSKLYTWVILSLKENVSTLIYVLIKIFVPGDVIAPSFVYDMISHKCLSLITWPMVRSAWAGDGKGNSRLVWCDSRCWH